MLGFILAPMGQKVAGQYPSEINYAYGGRGTYLGDDPQHNTRDQAGLYFDATIGGPAIPTDVELSSTYGGYMTYQGGRTPVAAAWVNAQEGYFPSPWRPPGGWNPAGAWGPQPSLSGFSDLVTDWRAWAALLGVAGLAWWGLRPKRKGRR